MKKFIFQIGLSFMLITMGVMMSFFELAEYDTVNGAKYVYETEVLKTEATEADPLYIEVDDDSVSIHYEYDDTMKNRVEIELSDRLEYSLVDNELFIDEENFRFFHGKKYLDTFIQGLKEEKLYYFNFTKNKERQRVTIRCRKDNLSNIDVYD